MQQTTSSTLSIHLPFKWNVLILFFLSLFTAAPLIATGWSTSGTQIYNPSGGPFVISGVNWYGAETTAYIPGGPWAQDYTFILNEIKQYGFNTIRLPYSNQMWETDPTNH